MYSCYVETFFLFCLVLLEVCSFCKTFLFKCCSILFVFLVRLWLRRFFVWVFFLTIQIPNIFRAWIVFMSCRLTGRCSWFFLDLESALGNLTRYCDRYCPYRQLSNRFLLVCQPRFSRHSIKYMDYLFRPYSCENWNSLEESWKILYFHAFGNSFSPVHEVFWLGGRGHQVSHVPGKTKWNVAGVRWALNPGT